MCPISPKIKELVQFNLSMTNKNQSQRPKHKRVRNVSWIFWLPTISSATIFSFRTLATHQLKTFSGFPMLLKHRPDSQKRTPSSLICHPLQFHVHQTHLALPTLATSSFFPSYLPRSSTCRHFCLECFSSLPSSLTSLELTLQSQLKHHFPTLTLIRQRPHYGLSWHREHVCQGLVSQLQFSICFAMIWLTVSCVGIGTTSDFAHHRILMKGSH